MKRLRKMDQKGFTLVELIIVIAILAVLVTLIVPRIMDNVEDARRRTAVGNARTLASEISVHNAKQVSDATWIKDTNSDGKIIQTEFTVHGMALPPGMTWPEDKYATIQVDGKGNASITVVTPTPVPGS